MKKSILKKEDDKRLNVEIENEDESSEYFSKHYIEPKKESLGVKFKEELVKVKQIETEIIQTATIEKEEAIIQRFKTIEEMDIYADKLLEQLRELKKKKLEYGYDVSYEYDNLKIKFELVKKMKEKISKKKNEEKQLRNEKIVHKQNSIVESVPTPTLSAKLFEFVDKSNYSDILFLFHSVHLYSDLLSYLKHRLEKHSMIRFSVGYYSDDLKIFSMNNFKNKQMSQKTLKDFMDIRSEVINLDWNFKNNTIVYNFATSSFSDQKMNQFIMHSDPVKELLNYNGIEFEKYYMDTSIIDRNSIDEITSDVFLNKSLTIMSRVKYLKKLYFLKRNSFKSIDEFIKSKKETKIENEYRELSKKFNDYNEFDCYKFVKNSLNSNVANGSMVKREIKFEEEIIQVTKNYYLIEAKYKYRCSYFFPCKSILWLEPFENEDIIKQIINIHLTAKFIVDNFNSKLNCISVEIVDIYQIYVSRMKMLCLETDKKIGESIISYRNDFTIEVIECLAHYSYETFNLIVIDLRPIELEKSKKILITEPVIFSSVRNKYGSSDLGSKGIESFFQNHICNSFCKILGLKKKI